MDPYNPDGGGPAVTVTPDVEAVAAWDVHQRAHQSIMDALFNLEQAFQTTSRRAAVPADVLAAMRAMRGAVTQAAVDWTAYKDAVREAIRRAMAAGRLNADQVALLREGGLAGIQIVLAVAVIIAAFAVGIGVIAALRGTAAASNARAVAIIAQNSAIVREWERRVAAAPGAPLPPMPAPNVPDPWPDAVGGAASTGLVAAVVLVGLFFFMRKG